MSKLLGVHIPSDIKNLAINGNMDFWQRVEGGSLALAAATTVYSADMFQSGTGGATVKSLTVSRSTSIPSQLLSNWQSNYSMQVVNNTAIPTFVAADYAAPFEYRMEGLDYVKIHAKTATVGFWFNTTVAGVYSVAFRNGTFTRSYVTTFTATVGFQFIAITLPLDTSTGGTWAFDNTIGLSVVIGAVSGTTYQTSTLNAWQTGNYLSASTSVNWVATAAATLNLAQFSTVEGPMGFGPRGFERAGDSVMLELALCQRCYCKSYSAGVSPGTITGQGLLSYYADSVSTLQQANMIYPVEMRSIPSVLIWNPQTGLSGSGRNSSGTDAGNQTPNNPTTRGFRVVFSSGQSATTAWVTFHWTADAGL